MGKSNFLSLGLAFIFFSQISIAQKLSWLSNSGQQSGLAFSQIGSTTFVNGQVENNQYIYGPVSFALDSVLNFDSTLVVYDIDSVPPLLVFYNNPVKFIITSVSLKSQNIGIGSVFYEVVSGRPFGQFATNRFGGFSYTTNSDTLDFVLRFGVVSANGDTIRGTRNTNFKIIPTLDYDTNPFGVGGTRNLPEADDAEFRVLVRDTGRILNSSKLNYVNGQNLVNIGFSGIDVVLENNNPANPLHLLNGVTFLDTLRIFAERLIIRGAFRFPQTTIEIYARELIFDDANGPSSISTTPKDNAIPGSETNGLKAGDIFLYISKFSANPGKRFILLGGNGTGDASRINGGNGGNLYATLDIKEYFYTAGGLANINVGRIGREGVNGQFFHQPSPSRWLHPNFFSLVVSRYKEAFYSGITDEIIPPLREYVGLLEQYVSDSSVNDWDQENFVQVSQIVDEILEVFYVVGNGLDYFGNPKGWVPMLSYEITAQAFKEEARQAILFMYLDEVIKKTGLSLSQRQAAFRNLLNEAKNDVNFFQARFKDLADRVIPDINREIDNNNSILDRLRLDLEEINRELENRARERYDDRQTWKWIKVAGEIASFIPDPFCNCIGKVLNAGVNVAANFAGPDARAGVAKGSQIRNLAGQVLDPFFSGGFEKDFLSLSNNLGNGVSSVFADIENANSLQDASKIKDKVVELYDQNKDKAKKIVGSITSAVDLFNTVTKVSNDEMGSIRGELLANEPRIGQIAERMNQIQQDQLKLSNQLQAATNELLQSKNRVDFGLTSISSFNQSLFNNATLFDPKLAVFSNKLRRTAFDRLRRYHYVMVKAYEYRTLQPYPGQLNLNTLVERIFEFTSNGSSNVSEATLDALEGIYLNEIKTVANEMFAYYNSNPPAQRITSTFTLNNDEVSEIRRGGVVKLNLIERGLFRDNDENVRIIDIRVRGVIANRIGALGTNDNVDINFTYPNYSRLKRNGQIFSFNNYNINTRSPIRWRSNFSFISNQIQYAVPSPDENSFLKFLYAGNSNGASNDMTIYSRPSAWADLELSLKYLSDAPSSILSFDNMLIDVVYDYNEKPSNIVNFELLTNNKWFAPTFNISRTDRFSFRSGSGNIHRSYSRNNFNQVRIEAPAKYGRYNFDYWANGKGEPLSQFAQHSETPHILSVTTASDRKLMAVYRFDGAILEVPDTVYLGDTLKYQLNIFNSGVGDLNWFVDSNSRWINLGGVTGSQFDTSFTLNFEPNFDKVRPRVGVLYIGSMETELLSNPVYFVQAPFKITGQSYRFRGSGSWSFPANWDNGRVPPATLNPGDEIIIDPQANGECILNVSQTVPPGAHFLIQPGKRFRVTGALNIQKPNN